MTKRSGYRGGTAGAGVSGANKKFGKNAAVGAQGERELHRALTTNKLTKGYDIWSSLSIPDAPPGVDVDIAVASGNRVVFVDAKKWSAKNFYWSIFGYPMSGMSPRRDRSGKWKPLSKNMSMAKDKYARKLPGAEIHCIVVFVPTGGRGASLPPSVRFLKFPGGIRSYLLQDGLRKINRILGEPTTTNPKISSELSSRTKRAKR